MQQRESYPWPLNITGKGNVNGQSFTLNGAGVIRCAGVYHAALNFSAIPAGFHPSAISMFIVSTCCDAGASERNGARNLRMRGTEGYEAHRELTFGRDKIVLDGTADYRGPALLLEVNVTGTVSLPDDLCGHAVYITRVQPQDGGRILALGEGSLFRKSGEEVKIGISTLQTLRPNPLPTPLRSPEFRIATESGESFGNSYHLTIHSIYDAINSMTEAERRR
jgi:hypothetical protein